MDVTDEYDSTNVGSIPFYEVPFLLEEGLTKKEIAERLGISMNKVNYYSDPQAARNRQNNLYKSGKIKKYPQKKQHPLRTKLNTFSKIEIRTPRPPGKTKYYSSPLYIKYYRFIDRNR